MVLCSDTSPNCLGHVLAVLCQAFSVCGSYVSQNIEIATSNHGLLKYVFDSVMYDPIYTYIC